MLALCHVPSRSPPLSLSLSLLTAHLFHPLIASLSLTRLSYSGNPVAPPVFYFSSIHVSPTSGLFFFLFPSVPLVSTTLSLSPLFPFFRPFLSPECSSPFAPIPRSLSLSWDNPSLLSLFYFHFPFASNPSLFFHSFFSLSLSLHPAFFSPVEHIVPLPFPAFARVSHPLLAIPRIFIFIFPFSRGRQSSSRFLRSQPERERERSIVLVALSLARSLSVESVRNERNDYGANGVAMSPTEYRVSGRDWQQRVYAALSFTSLLFFPSISSFSLSSSVLLLFLSLFLAFCEM